MAIRRSRHSSQHTDLYLRHIQPTPVPVGPGDLPVGLCQGSPPCTPEPHSHRTAVGRPPVRLPSRTQTPRSDRAGCTNSASATASVRFFFKRLANRLGANGPDYLTLDQLVSQQLQGPTGTPLRRFPAGHRYQPCFTFAVQSLLCRRSLFDSADSTPSVHTACKQLNRLLTPLRSYS